MQDAFEAALAEGWGLSIKEGSRSCLVASGSQEHTPDEDKWPQYSHFDALGHTISDTGAIRPSWSKCRSKMWAAFFRNFAGASIQRAPISSKTKCIERAVRPMISYRCSIWPPQKQVATELDAIQRKMISIACPISRMYLEDSAGYARRKGRQASSLATATGLWSKHWFDRAVSWDDHVQRSRSGCKWNSSLRAFHDSNWLQECRASFVPSLSTMRNPWTSFAGRTGTRAAAGKFSLDGRSLCNEYEMV